MNANTEAKAIRIFNNAKTLSDVVEALNTKDVPGLYYEHPSNAWWNAYHNAIEHIGAVRPESFYYWCAKRNGSVIEYIANDYNCNKFHVFKCVDNEAPEEVLEALAE